jgi:GH24 family phage-related lysozyme (muramidase)
MTPQQRTAALAAVGIASSAAVGHEGIRYLAYYDPVKIPTICVGRTTNVKMGDRATHEQCMKWLGEEMMRDIERVQTCHPHIDFTPPQLAAFADITYNVGPKPVCDPKNSTRARLLDAGDVAAACREFPKWDKARVFGVLVALPGLTKRRAANQALCEGRTPSLGAHG